MSGRNGVNKKLYASRCAVRLMVLAVRKNYNELLCDLKVRSSPRASNIYGDIAEEALEIIDARRYF